MPICIIGMHRSGTSMIARLLNLCGLDLGPSERFLAPNEFNPLGYFETEGFVEIDDALLAHFEGSWDNPPLFKEGWEYDPSLEQIVHEARLLLKTFSGSSQWGWKDPRTTVLLPFWKSLIPDLRFVICIRSPLEVAESLARRDRMAIQKGVYLWDQYMRAAIRDTEGCSRIFTFYEDFFKDALGETKKVVEFCGLQKPDDLSSLYSVISSELKHHTSETFELLNESKVITEYKLFYIGLRALSIDGFVQSTSYHTREEFISENISKFFKLLEQFHDEQEMAQLQSVLADKEQQITGLHATVHKQQKAQSQKEEQVSQLIAQQGALNQELKGLQVALYQKEEQVGQLQAAVQAQEQVLGEKEKQVTQLRAEREQLAQETFQLQATAQAQEQALREKEEQVVQLRAERERLAREASELQASVEAREQALVQRDELIRQMAVEKERLNQALQVVNDSLGWWLITKYHGLKEKLMPLGTFRRTVYKLFWKSLKMITFQGWSSFVPEAKNKLKTFKIRFRSPSVILNLPLTFRAVEEPKVSIIIPVFNTSSYTYQCLKSILENTPQDLYEIIVVDNALTDDTQKVLKEIKNIKVITNSDNLGPVDACNKGSMTARGEYILFLNNDTVVTQGWLTAMLSTYDRDEVGAVGAKLLYPDGRLQEAGGIIWKDGTGWNYGIGDNPNKPEYNYVREVDYCSRSCLLVRADVLKKIGFFERRYAPCHFEDVDLAFSLREHGYKIFYQPKAVVVHYEGAPADRDVATGFKKNQEVNRLKFVAKWRQVLDEQHFMPSQDIADNMYVTRERGFKNRILVVDRYVPEYDKDSGSLRMYEYVRIFIQLGYKVVFWPDNLHQSIPYTEELQQLGVEVIYGDVNFEHYIKRNGRYFDIAYLSRANVAEKYLDIIKRHSKMYVIYDTVDLGFVREGRRSEIERSSHLRHAAHSLKDTELYLASQSDMVIVVSEVEKEVLLSEDSKLRVSVVPHVYRVASSIPGYEERDNLIFIGGFWHSPNVDGILWFVDKIFPKIKEKIPGIRLYIIGSNPTKEILCLNSEQITVTGYVKDVEPLFNRCRVFVAPLRYGAGIKGKILQSMIYGVPVVTTTTGAEGMDLANGENAMVASEEAEFAKGVIRLYSDRSLWNKLSRNSVAHVKGNHTPELCRDKFTKLFDEIMAEGVEPKAL